MSVTLLKSLTHTNTPLCMYHTGENAHENSRYRSQLDNASYQRLFATLRRPAVIMAACADLADSPELVSAAATIV